MSIRINKAGLLDTIQDLGRFGYQHWGINPGGAMDAIGMQVVNMLVGNKLNDAVLEIHFPSAELVFEQPALIALAGGDFNFTLDDISLPIHQPALVKAGAVLKCGKNISGARVYLAVAGGLTADEWLRSYSTQLKVHAGGYHGRALAKNDVIACKYSLPIAVEETRVLPWRADTANLYQQGSIRFIAGAEYDWLDAEGKDQLQQASFILGRNSDRMGYRLQSAALKKAKANELISTAVTRGTMQLLPEGQLIILMADHQTTGGYPRVGHIISADLPSLAQTVAGTEIRFQQTTIEAAEELLRQQQRNLHQLQNACTLRLQSLAITN